MDDKCFGQWIVTDFENLDSQMAAVLTTSDMSTAMGSIISILQTVYRLGFTNSEYCRFNTAWSEASAFYAENYKGSNAD